jgi:hypothetical protein
MIDGVLENHTGVLLEPYCDGCGGHTDNRGLRVVGGQPHTNIVIFVLHGGHVGRETVLASQWPIRSSALRTSRLHRPL